ncbi:MAG: hypothetical protein M3290_08140 [Actinomycetota bacterium]|nr:hypothetical protein [Actinomycetota bacterium]
MAKELFARERSLILIYKWKGSAVSLGERLVVCGSKDVSPAELVPAAELRWPHEVEPELLRAAHLLPTTDSYEWSRSLLRVAAICATQLFESAARTRSIDESVLPPHWEVPDSRAVESAGVEGILALIRWTSREPTAVRLAIAWRVAADRIVDPLNGPSAASLVSVAEIAYESAIDTGVRDALSRQAELEKNFREIDSSIASSRESMTGAVEGTVTRALAAVVAVGIAAVTSDDFRGWPLVAAAVLIAVYLALQATLVLASNKRDIKARLKTFDLLISGRSGRLGDDLSREIQRWEKRLDHRVRFSRAALIILAMLVFVAGAVAAKTSAKKGGHNRDSKSQSHKPHTGRATGSPPPSSK